jgi:trk system potassium uptake protein TrkH
MHIKIILKIIGLLLMVFSFTMLPPALIGHLFEDGNANHFIMSFCISFTTGLLVWFPLKHEHHELRIRDGFIVVVVFWSTLSIFGGLPFFLSTVPRIDLTDALFESVSGLTTTGSSIFPDLSLLPKSLLYYRQQMQWLGGMGIIVLAVAILPMLGVGGLQLFKAEAPGPNKDNKLTPRIAGTAKALWIIYTLMTLACLFAYLLCGMDWFDAVCHAFSTVATGGFSPYNEGIAYFDSVNIAGNNLLRTNDDIDGNGFVVKEFALRRIIHAANTRDACGCLMKCVRDLAGNHIDLIGIRDSDEHVRIFDASLSQGAGMRAVAFNGVKIKALFEVIQT